MEVNRLTLDTSKLLGFRMLESGVAGHSDRAVMILGARIGDQKPPPPQT